MTSGAGQQPAAIGLNPGQIRIDRRLHQALAGLHLQAVRSLGRVMGLQVDRDHLQCIALGRAFQGLLNSAEVFMFVKLRRIFCLRQSLVLGPLDGAVVVHKGFAERLAQSVIR